MRTVWTPYTHCTELCMNELRIGNPNGYPQSETTRCIPVSWKVRCICIGNDLKWGTCRCGCEGVHFCASVDAIRYQCGWDSYMWLHEMDIFELVRPFFTDAVSSVNFVCDVACLNWRFVSDEQSTRLIVDVFNNTRIYFGRLFLICQVFFNESKCQAALEWQ